MDIVSLLNKYKKQGSFTTSQLCSSAGVSYTQMSKYLNGHTKIPFQVVNSCMELMGYDVMIGKKADNVSKEK